MKNALLLRGHERDVFKNRRLYDFVSSLKNEGLIGGVFVHTWSKSEASFSWRPLHNNKRNISKQDVENYFGKLLDGVMVEEEGGFRPSLNGNLNGRIGGQKRISWKFMWAGIESGLFIVRGGGHENILSMRLDFLDTPRQHLHDFCYDFDAISNMIRGHESGFSFLQNYPCAGIDNAVLSSTFLMEKLIDRFTQNQDEIEKFYAKNLWFPSQEKLVFWEAKRLEKEYMAGE